MKQKWKKIGNVLATLLIVVELMIIVFIVVSRISGGVPTVFGYQMYVIVTPSMEPEIMVGDMIISKKYDGGELAVGDVVTYLGREGDVADKVITHKIVEINGDTIVTQGVANATADPAITREDVLAVMVCKPAFLSAVYGLLNTPAGFICLILIPLAAMIVSEIISLMIQIKKEGGTDDEESR